MRRVLLVTVLGLGLPANGVAQDGSDGPSLREHGPLVLELPASTRALALGNVFHLFSNESDALFYNPALLSTSEGVGAAGQRFGGTSHLGTVSGATDWSSGNVGVGVQILEYGASTRDAAQLPADEGSLTSAGATGAVEIVAAIGYGRTVQGLRVGVTGKLIDQRLGGRQDATGAIDVGVARDMGVARVGVAVQNLGPGMTFADTDIPLPNRVTVGASTRTLPVGILDMSWTAAVARRADGSVIPGGGMEVGYWPVNGRTFTARVGVRRVPDGLADPLTFGGAFTGDKLAIDYAYQGYDGESGAHRIGLSWR